MLPACPKVNGSKNVMRLSEKLVAGQSNHSLETSKEQEAKKDHSNNAPNHVVLRDELIPDLRLRLVELALHQRPSNCVKHSLDIDDAAGPDMEKHEMLVRNSGEDSEQVLPS
jgi:hypothetical protein